MAVPLIGLSILTERFRGSQVTAHHLFTLVGLVSILVLAFGLLFSPAKISTPTSGPYENIFTGECIRFHGLDQPWYYERNKEKCGHVMVLPAVESECERKLAKDINEHYCDLYINTAGNTPDCTNVRSNATDDYDTTAREAECNWYNDPAGTLDMVMEQGEPVVTVQGEDYNCLEKGFMEPTCPA